MTKLGTFEADVQLLEDGTFDAYISHEGSSGAHYEHVTADRIGVLVADDIECIAENYGNVAAGDGVVRSARLGYHDPYKVVQIEKMLNASDFYAYLSGDHKTSGAHTINLDGQALEILKAFYEGKKITIEEKKNNT